MTHPLDRYLRPGMIPHIWCPGCGNGIILNAFLRAVDELGLDQDEIVVVSGIGCMGRVSGYVNMDGFHTTHGRAIPVAIGIKTARPELKVVVISGDGDLFAIGGNHFLHAARRNVDLLVICANNFNYGMTGGQMGPTTPSKAYTTTTPYGNIEHPLNLVYLAASLGAVYIARWCVTHPLQLKESIKRGLTKRGFSFIEVVTPCVTEYGRRNRMGEPREFMRRLREICVIRRGVDPSEAVIEADRIICGEFRDVEKPEFTQLLWDMIREVSEKASRGEIEVAL